MGEPVVLSYAASAETRGLTAWRTATWWLVLVSALVCVLALVAIVALDVESVLFTGPALLGLGIAQIVGGVRVGRLDALALGVAHCAICLLLFALVNLLRWSPGDAYLPFLMMGVVYDLVILPASVAVLLRIRRA